MTGGKPTPQNSQGALVGQGGRSRTLGIRDPRHRRGAQALQTDAFTGAYVTLDEQGRLTVDYAALISRLRSDIGVTATVAQAAVLAGAYLFIDGQGRVALDYSTLLAQIVQDTAGTSTAVADLQAAFEAHVAGFEEHGITAYGSTLVQSADAATARSTLGLTLSPTLFKVLSAAANVTDSTAAQAWFPTNGAVTLTVNRAYWFEGGLRLSKGTGVATDVHVGFAGTATVTLDWESIGQAFGFDTAGNVQVSSGRTTAAHVAASPSGTQANVWAQVRGVVRCTGAGTLIPQFSFATAAPGGTPQALRGTRFALWDIGDNAVTERGTWS